MELLEYVTKLQNMADYLARGEILQDETGYTAIEIVDDEMVRQRKAFSVQEYDIYDVLESSFFGEQRSIGILMEYLRNGAYEQQVEARINFDESYTPEEENAEFYQMVMKRVKAILRVMSFSLISGVKVPLEDNVLAELEEFYFEEDEDEMDSEDIQLVEEGEEEPEEIEPERGFIVYDITGQRFTVIDQNGEGIIEAISVGDAMEIYNDFLIQEERRHLEAKAIADLEKEREKVKQEREKAKQEEQERE